MLAGALHASLVMNSDRQALFRIVTDRVGHHFPSGGNWVSVRLEAVDAAGRVLAQRVEAFGREEALLLDFWPFAADTRIPSGARKEVVLPIPDGHGTVRATVQYHDWMKVKRRIAAFEERY